jgi:3-oxoacyl-[acyl-carrier protein] reductase
MEPNQMNARKAAIVTGSATGVGAATALALARRGYDVLINYTKSEREARETERVCRDAGADTLCVRADVALDIECRKHGAGGARSLEPARCAGQ